MDASYASPGTTMSRGFNLTIFQGHLPHTCNSARITLFFHPEQELLFCPRPPGALLPAGPSVTVTDSSIRTTGILSPVGGGVVRRP